MRLSYSMSDKSMIKFGKKDVKSQIDSTLRSASKGRKEINNTRSFVEILSKQMLDSFHVYRLQWRSLMLNSIIAGLEIGFSYLLLATLYSLLIDRVSDTYIFPMFALVYPVGFVMVVLGKSILFTEQTALLTLPVLSGKKRFSSLVSIWSLVIAGNLLGGTLFSILTFFIAPSLEIFSVSDMADIANYVLGIDLWIMFFSAILAGWLMGLMSWILSSTDETISRIIMVFLITGTIGFLGLHHSIVGSIEVFLGLLASSDIGVLDYFIFLIIVLLGNAVGGAIFVALFKYGAFLSNFSETKNNK